MIASGLEASRWGFSAFGFAPFVAASPGNFVAALGNYWIDRVSRMVAFESSCELAHARLYYELLCDDPATTLRQLFEFLEVAPDEGVLDRTFDREHGVGPGDYKIDYSGSIAVDSIGRGSVLPEHLSEPQVTRINELLAQLDYPELDAARRGDLRALLGMKRGAPATGDVREIASAVAQRLGAEPKRGLSQTHREGLPIEILIRGERGSGNAFVLLDNTGQASVIEKEPEEHPTPRVRCIGDVLLKVAAGEMTFARAVHENLIRVEVENGTLENRPARPHRMLATLAAVMRAAS
jgi:hypothetical protein